MSGKREYGDYQTPDSFALSVCEYLKEKRGINPAVVIDKTTPRLIQFHILKNAVNPPFLGGFLFSAQ